MLRRILLVFLCLVPASSPAQMIVPTSIGLAADAEGNLYVAVPAEAIVHKVSPSGMKTVVAGTGVPGFSGDGGPATSAQLRGPASLAVDASGNLYIGESGNLRVRKVTRNGVINSLAGTGVPADSGDGGAATAAQFKSIQGVAVDSGGNVYVSDAVSGRVRRIAPNGTITTVAEQLQSPYGITTDGQGNVYVATGNVLTEGFRIRRIRPNSPVETIAPSDGTGFGIVQFVAADATGNVYFADPNNARVRRITADGRVETVAGNGTRGTGGDGASAIATGIGPPTRVAVDGLGNVFFLDSLANSIRKVAPDGKLSTIPYTVSVASPVIALANSIPLPPPVVVRQSPSLPAPPPARPGYVAPYAVSTPPGTIDSNQRQRGIRGAVQLEYTVDETGQPTDIKVLRSLDCEFDKVAVKALRNWKYEPARQDGRPEKATLRNEMRFGSIPPLGSSQYATGAALKSPMGVTVDASGNLYVSSKGNSNIRRVTSAGTVSLAVATGFVNSPSDVAVDGAGTLYIADTGNFRVLKVTSTTSSALIGKGTFGFSGDGGSAACAEVRNVQGIAVDKNGVVYISDSGTQRIRSVTADGIIRTIAGTGDSGLSGDGGPAVAARLNSPSGIAVDAAGNLYVADTGNNRIRKIGPDGTITTIAGTELASPRGVAIDAAGNLYVADTGNHRIRKITAGGAVSTVESSGTPGLKSPSDVAVDAAGTLFISDTGNNLVRKITPNGVLSTVTGSAK